MDQTTLSFVIAGVLTLLFAVTTALIWSRAQVKTVFWWIGLTLLPLAVVFLGLGPAVEGAWETLRAWAMGTTFGVLHWVGVAMGGLGLLLMLGSRLIPSESYKDRRAAAKAKKGVAQQQQRPAVSGRTSTPAAAPRPAPGTPVKAQGTGDAEMDEIADLLRKRGIN